jgi:hypothetical protein
MKTIALGGKKARGRLAEVDDGADYDLVSAYSWWVWEQQRGPGCRLAGPYAHARIPRPGGGYSIVSMHVLITGIHTGIDHVDGNGLNCQRYNLRKAGQPLNGANRRVPLVYAGKPKSSRYKGVTWFRTAPGKGRDKWVAQIRVDRKVRKLGRFEVEEDAARAYNAAAMAAWGEFCLLNEVQPRFPWGDEYPSRRRGSAVRSLRHGGSVIRAEQLLGDRRDGA